MLGCLLASTQAVASESVDIYARQMVGKKGDDVAVAATKLDPEFYPGVPDSFTYVVQMHQRNNPASDSQYLYFHVGLAVRGFFEGVYWADDDQRFNRKLVANQVSVSVNNQGIVAETHRLNDVQNGYNYLFQPDIGVYLGKLINVENINETTIRWQQNAMKAPNLEAGKDWNARRKRVSINDDNDIVLIDTDASSRFKGVFPLVHYSLGKIRVDEENFPIDIDWDKERIRIVPPGPAFPVNAYAVRASVAINNEGDVLVVYDNGGDGSTLWSHVGTIEEDEDTGERTIVWHNEIPRAIPTPTINLNGRLPEIDLTDDRRVMINHRGVGSQYVWLAAGYLAPIDDPIDGVELGLIVDFWKRLGGENNKSERYNGVAFLDKEAGYGNTIAPHQYILMYSSAGRERIAHLRYHTGMAFPPSVY